MKKIISVMLLLLVITIASAQKMTIKTGNGQTVEITCDKMTPGEIVIEGNKVILKIKAEEVKKDTVKVEPIELIEPITEAPVAVDTLETDSIDTFVPVEESLAANGEDSYGVGDLANSLLEEYVPEYAKFNAEHANYKPSSEKEVVKDFAKGLVGEEAVETADFLGTLFGGLRFTKDTTFVAKYEQRKPKKDWRSFNTIVVEGSLGKNISNISDKVADEIDEKDYGDNTENEKKYGAGLQFSRGYILGTTDDNGKWIPNPLGFAWSWGGLIAYSYEKDMGSYFSAMAKAGIQIGTDIAIGADALLGCGITPYNTFYSNGMNHSVLNKSAFCFKYGVQVWGTLNLNKDTYTMAYGRYISSVKPSSSFNNLPQGWEVILEDFDPSSWTVGLAVGYKFGAPKPLSTDKRLQAGISTGYQFAGVTKGMLLSAELERLTKVSYSTSLNYGLSIEQLFGNEEPKIRYSSVLLSAGFKVDQPFNRWFWSTKLYGGIGDYSVTIVGNHRSFQMETTSKKLCAKAAFQLSGGFKLGKLSEVFTACRLGYHLGNSIEALGLDDSNYKNLSGFEADWRLGYKLTF